MARPAAAWYWTSSLIAVVLYAIAAPVGAVAYGLPAVAALILSAISSAALIVVRNVPWVAIGAFAASGVLTAFWIIPGWLPWPWPVTTMVWFVVLIVGTWLMHGWRRGLGAFIIPGLAISLVAANAPTTGESLASWIVALSLGAVAVGVGALLSDRVRMAGQLTRERAVTEAETERRLVSEERQRIARELQDVVAHGLSLVQVQATSAPYRVPELSERATEEFADIARAARASLHEMRSLLSALRGDEETVERAPQPALADIARFATFRDEKPSRARLPLNALMEREREVLAQVGRGLSNSEIAAELFIGEQTVKTHVGRLLQKLPARDRVQLVITAYDAGLVSPA